MEELNKKGITVKVDAGLHAEIRQYLEAHEMTMSEFISKALDEWLHPVQTEKEGNIMGNTRTIAFQVTEDLFQKIKDYLQRNHMSQRQFLVGLIEDELERDMRQRETDTVDPDDDPGDGAGADNGRERYPDDEPPETPDEETDDDMCMSM